MRNTSARATALTRTSHVSPTRVVQCTTHMHTMTCVQLQSQALSHLHHAPSGACAHLNQCVDVRVHNTRLAPQKAVYCGPPLAAASDGNQSKVQPIKDFRPPHLIENILYSGKEIPIKRGLVGAGSHRSVEFQCSCPPRNYCVPAPWQTRTCSV